MTGSFGFSAAVVCTLSRNRSEGLLGGLTLGVLVTWPSLSRSRNIIHGSDSVESAEKEIGLWFRPEELVDYKSCAQNWIYE